MLHLRGVILALLGIELTLQARGGSCCTADLHDGRRSLQQDAAIHCHCICRHREQRMRQWTAVRPAAEHRPDPSVTETVLCSSGSTLAARLLAQQRHYRFSGEFGQAGLHRKQEGHCTETAKLCWRVLCLKIENVACSRGRERVLARARSGSWVLRREARSRAVPQG